MSAFYIASLNHTGREDQFITFWGWFHRGYTPVIGKHMGCYCFGEAVALNDGINTLAVPVEVIEAIAMPEPFFACQGRVTRWFDQRGPVVRNTKGNWKAMLAASFPDGRRVAAVKPEVCTRKAHWFILEDVVQAA